jgi:hypothetical protein
VIAIKGTDEYDSPQTGMKFCQLGGISRTMLIGVVCWAKYNKVDMFVPVGVACSKIRPADAANCNIHHALNSVHRQTVTEENLRA